MLTLSKIFSKPFAICNSFIGEDKWVYTSIAGEYDGPSFWTT